jgi:hypothetical protein
MDILYFISNRNRNRNRDRIVPKLPCPSKALEHGRAMESSGIIGDGNECKNRQTRRNVGVVQCTHTVRSQETETKPKELIGVIPKRGHPFLCTYRQTKVMKRPQKSNKKKGFFSFFLIFGPFYYSSVAKMGRKKIAIKRITDPRRRQVTFSRRKFGLMKKAYELSVLCNCDVALMMFTPNHKLFVYSSINVDELLLKYTDFTENGQPSETLKNEDMLRLIERSKKEGVDFFNEDDGLGEEEEEEDGEEHSDEVSV